MLAPGHQRLAVPGREWPRQGAGHPGRPDQPLPRARSLGHASPRISSAIWSASPICAVYAGSLRDRPLAARPPLASTRPCATMPGSGGGRCPPLRRDAAGGGTPGGSVPSSTRGWPGQKPGACRKVDGMTPGLAPDTSPRQCLPLATWPATDQACWRAATCQGDLLLDAGPAAHLRPGSLDRHAAGYGRWLRWLADQGQLEPADAPATLSDPRIGLTPMSPPCSRVNAPRTVLNRLTDLATVLRLVRPRAGLDWLHRGPGQSESPGPARPRQAGPVAQCPRTACPRPAADAHGRDRPLPCPATARACPPLPRRADDRPARPFARCGWPISPSSSSAGSWYGATAHWWLELQGTDTKTGEPLELPFPDDLVPALEAYLNTWRPRLAPAALRRGEQGIVAHPPRHHDQRHPRLQTYHRRPSPARPSASRSTRICSVTPPPPRSLLDRPEQVRTAARLLGHRSFATTERFYNLARTSQAAIAWHETLARIRG